MIGGQDLDRALVAWLAEDGMDRAPQDRVERALEEVASVRQRRPIRAWWMRAFGLPQERLPASRVLAIALAAAVLTALVYGVGARLLELRVVTPVPSPMFLTPPSQVPPRSPSPTRSDSPSSLQPLPSAVVAPNRATATVIGGAWSAELPVDWAGGPTQPVVGGVAVVGAVHFGPMVVSLGSIDGRLGDCDVIACRLLTGATSLGELERAIGQIERPGAIRGDITLAGDPGRFSLSEQSDRSALYRVYAIHRARPILITFELEDVGYRLDRPHADEIVRSFAYEEPTALEPGPAIADGAGTWSTTLPEGWTVDPTNDPNSASARNEFARLSVRTGDTFGRIIPCLSTKVLESCDPFAPASLDALLERLAPTPEALSFGTRFVRTWSAEHGILDGEPAITLYKEIYGVGAPHRQALGHVIAIHNGRPFEISVIIDSDFARRLGDLREILTAVASNFRFGS
jgi:hypothetical protein